MTKTCHANSKHRAPEPRGRHGMRGDARARADITPLAEPQVPRLPIPRTELRSPGNAKGRQATPARTSRTLQSPKCRACQANSTHSPGAQGTLGDARDARAYITPLESRSPGDARGHRSLHHAERRACHRPKTSYRIPFPQVYLYLHIYIYTYIF